MGTAYPGKGDRVPGVPTLYDRSPAIPPGPHCSNDVNQLHRLPGEEAFPARKAALPAEIRAHSSRGTGTTEYPRNGGDNGVAARVTAHESRRNTRLPKRMREEILLDETERNHIWRSSACGAPLE